MGTPSQRQECILSLRATNVGVREPCATSFSCWYPGTSLPAMLPAAYCPSTTFFCTASGESKVSTARSTLIFSSRTASASNATGGSMAVRQSSCSTWFWIMSRRMPASL